ncbi:MAG: hypothetical protein WA786_07890 [Acidimicrobiales bacterium]
MAVWIRVVAGCIGVFIQLLVLDAAIRTFLLPRVANVRLSRLVSKLVGAVFRMIAKSRRTYAARDKVLSLYASIVLLAYQALWLALSVLAFGFGFVAAGVPSYAHAFEISGSSLFTLGTSSGTSGVQQALGFIEAGVGLTLLALLISFIPTLYTAFQRRELSVARLAVRAGTPATPWGILEVAQSVQSFEKLDKVFQEWEQWFIDVGETHTTLTILNYYRSPSPEQTWIAAAATVLDAAAMFNSTVDVPPSASAGLCIRSGWIALRRLADYFRIPYPLNPDRSIPIAVTRHEFDLVLEHLARSGVPLVPDHDAAWNDFVGWRVNYDAIIEDLHVRFTCPRIDWNHVQDQPLLPPSNVRGN